MATTAVWTSRRHTLRLWQNREILVATTIAYGVFVAVGAASDNSQTVFYAVLIPVLVALVALLDSRSPLSPLVLWGLALWAALHLAGGLVPASDDRVLYNVWLLPFVRFDHLVHAIGFGFAGLMFREAVRSSLSGATSGA